MDRIRRLIALPSYKAYLNRLQENEKARIYCRHGLEHGLDVARVAYILYLENNSFKNEQDRNRMKELIYAAALVHDLGRALDAEHHEEAGAKIAEKLLPSAGFTDSETEQAVEAVLMHRHGQPGSLLARLISLADDLSRPCFACDSQKTCYKFDQMPCREAPKY